MYSPTQPKDSGYVNSKTNNIFKIGFDKIMKVKSIIDTSVIPLLLSKPYFMCIPGVFLPGFVKPQDCRSKEGVLNKPLCIAWSSSGRNHYIPLVGVKGRFLSDLPKATGL